MLLLSWNSHRWWIWCQCNLSDPFPAMSVHGGLLTAPGGASKPKGIQGGALSMRAQSPKIRPRLDCPVVAWAVSSPPFGCGLSEAALPIHDPRSLSLAFHLSPAGCRHREACSPFTPPTRPPHNPALPCPVFLPLFAIRFASGRIVTNIAARRNSHHDAGSH